MNSVRQGMVRQLLIANPDMTPKQAYEAVKAMKLLGKRKEVKK